jgi:hypothetical protein
MRSFTNKIITTFSLLLVLSSGQSIAAQNAPVTDESPQPKILPLLAPMATTIFSALLDIVRNRVTTAIGNSDPATAQQQVQTVPIGQQIASAVGNAITTFISTPPTQPLTVQNEQTNYQAALISVAVYDKDGKPLGERPVSAAFYTGERIKLRVQPTFTGWVEVDNINPQGNRTNIYPETGSALQVMAGQVAMVPMRDDQFFEFTNAAGMEQLVVTLRDPRAQGVSATTAQPYRQDAANGSYYAQPVTAGTYPTFTQAIQFVHR